MDAPSRISTLILMAPCSFLVGAALQILVARLCSARAKGILAFLTCLPAIFAVIGMAPLVRSGQAHRPETVAVGRPARPRPPCRRAQRALRLHGRVHRRPGAALLHRLHGARQIGHALLRHHAGLHRRLHQARSSAPTSSSSISAGNWSASAPSRWSASGTPIAKPSTARAKFC